MENYFTENNSLVQYSYFTDQQQQQQQNSFDEINTRIMTNNSNIMQENLGSLGITASSIMPYISPNQNQNPMEEDQLLGLISAAQWDTSPLSSSSSPTPLSLTLATSSSSTSESMMTMMRMGRRGSGYVEAVQEILAQIAAFSLDHNYHTVDRSAGYYGLGSSSSNHGGEAKKAKLLALLQMVDERYNQCVDEIHTVVSAFHAATELDPRLHARFALRTISTLYNGLRDRISRQCLAIGDDNGLEDPMGLVGPSGGPTRDGFENDFIHKQWALQQLKKKDHQLWRPQRGLPEKSVSVLRAWMFQNFLHPYPKDAEKHLLAIKSGLTRNQVSNWFINARVRLWKPMIEEMYAEMSRRKTRRNDNNESPSQRSLIISTTNNMQRHH